MKTATRPDAGFTLIELLVAGTLGAVMVSVVLGFLLGTQRSWDQSNEGIERTQNGRAALQLLNRDLRMAGSGFGGRAVVAGGVPNNRIFPLATGYGTGGDPDTLHILAAMSARQSVTSAALPDPSSPLLVADATPFAEGDLIVVTDGTRANLFELGGVDPHTNTLIRSSVSPYNGEEAHANWPGVGYPQGTSVVQVQRVSYWIEGEPENRRLVRQTNSADPVPVAADVEEMAMRYEMSDGSWTDMPGDMGLVLGVTVQCLTRPTRDEEVGDTLTVRIKPRVLSLETTGIAAGGGL